MAHESLGSRWEELRRQWRLLEHPFYQRWSAGEVSREELAQYAAQYRHFERAFPSLLERISQRAATERMRQQALRNLADERGGTVTHLQLFEEFARAADAPAEAPASPAMAALLQTYEDALGASPAAAMGALWAYESQAPEVSRSKAEGLRRHFGMDASATAFWDVHSTLDVDHAQWALEAIEAEGAAHAVEPWVAAAAKAWWHFLDERDSGGRPCHHVMISSAPQPVEPRSSLPRS